MKVSNSVTNLKNDKLATLIDCYNCDKELNRLKDILDYLKNNYLYLPVSIKISKQKLMKIPTTDIIMILINLEKKLNLGLFSVYSSDQLINSQYHVELTIYDCFNLMKKFKGVKEIIINPNYNESIIIDETLILYLKKIK